MARNLIHEDGICRRRLIRAIIARARAKGCKVPSQSKIGRALGISQVSVSYHMRRLKSEQHNRRLSDEVFRDDDQSAAA